MGRTSRRIEIRLARFGCAAAATWYAYDWWQLRPSSAMKLPQAFAIAAGTTCQERRGQTIQKLRESTAPEYDVCVIGGGVVGLYTALDARLRGLSVILFEAEDFGCGSMSSGVGLVSGGFTNCQRALRQREGIFLRYAIEMTREATIWCNVAPQCVTPLLDTILPSFHSTEQLELVLAAWMSSVLSLLVGGMWRSGRWLSIGEARKRVDDENLKGAVMVQDLVVDGRAAAIALAKTAERAGVELLSYCPVTNIELEENLDGSSSVAVITAHDGYTSESMKQRKGRQSQRSRLTIKAKTVVNCCGSWADTIRGFDTMKHSGSPTSFFDRTVAYSWLVVAADSIQREMKGGVVPQGLVVNSNVRSFPSASIVPFSAEPPVALLGSACSPVSQLPDKMGATAAQSCKGIMRASDGYQAVLTATASQLARLGLRIEVAPTKPVTCLSTLHSIIVPPTLTGANVAQELYMRGFHVEGRLSKSPMVHVIGGNIGLSRLIAEEAVNICQEKIFRIDATTPEGQKRKKELTQSIISTVALDERSDESAANNSIVDQVRQFATSEYAMSVTDVILRRTRVAYHSPLETWEGVVAVAKIMGDALRWSPAKVDEEVRNAREVLRRIAVQT